MSTNPVRVQAKPLVTNRPLSRHWLVIAIAIAATLFVTCWYDWFYGRLGILAAQPVIEQTKDGRVIRVPPGGNIQAALEQAAAGDVVELQAGAIYNGQVSLPNKPLADFVTIRSSRYAELPEGKRVSPADKDKMATIVAGMAGRGAIMAANGANHYRFVGIEFTANSVTFNYGIVVLGYEEKRPELVPHDIEIDRSYIHPSGQTISRRGVALNSANTTVKNSYIEGFAYPEQETQGVCGWTGTRDVHVINNYVEGGAENILFGGADPASADLIPHDIEVRGNYLNKPADWNGHATVKTLFELKNAKHVEFVGNLLTNNWIGSAFRITVRNQNGGAPFSTIEDVVIRDNVIKGAGDGINILGTDNEHPSQTLEGLTIENNLLLHIAADNDRFQGSGYFIQVSGGRKIVVTRNTVFNIGNIATFYGEMPQDISVSENIVSYGHYGVSGIDIKSPAAREIFRNNIFVNMNGVPESDLFFPPGNLMAKNLAEAGLANLPSGDYMATPKHGIAVGCDVRELSADLRNALPRQ